MSANIQYPALARLLTLNNQVHDLENQLLAVPVPATAGSRVSIPGTVDIAEMQERIDQGVRASLTTCWLGMPEDPDD
jgi:hypothetical protein